MIIHLTKEKTTQELEHTGSVTELLQELNINPETVIVEVNGQIVGDEHTTANEDTVKIYSVISGG